MWSQKTVEQYVTNQIQENLNLDYKASRAFSKSDGAIREISKDVSAMANSQGGVIIYGVKEFDEKEKRHLPEKIDPVDQTVYTKEWLEQVINSNIHPKIQGIAIHPVQIDTHDSHVIYVVEIPQSITAHQAKDLRYYKRFNFQTEPMEDYEIRDIMNRANIPSVSIRFGLYNGVFEVDKSTFISYRGLRAIIRNEGTQIINKLKLSMALTNIGWYEDTDEFVINSMVDFGENSNNKDITITKRGNLNGSVDLIVVYQTEYVIFPQEEIDLGGKLGWGYEEDIETGVLGKWKEFARDAGWEIKWKLFADNMPFIEGTEKVFDLPTMPPYTS